MTPEELETAANGGAFTVEWAGKHLEPYVLLDHHVSSSDFSWALRQLKAGRRIRRSGWNGKGMWLALWEPGTYASSSELFENCPWARAHAAEAASLAADVGGCIVMKAADGSLVFGWLASQTDMLVEDWGLVEWLASIRSSFPTVAFCDLERRLCRRELPRPPSAVSRSRRRRLRTSSSKR